MLWGGTITHVMENVTDETNYFNGGLVDMNSNYCKMSFWRNNIYTK